MRKIIMGLLLVCSFMAFGAPAFAAEQSNHGILYYVCGGGYDSINGFSDYIMYIQPVDSSGHPNGVKKFYHFDSNNDFFAVVGALNSAIDLLGGYCGITFFTDPAVNPNRIIRINAALVAGSFN